MGHETQRPPPASQTRNSSSKLVPDAVRERAEPASPGSAEEADRRSAADLEAGGFDRLAHGAVVDGIALHGQRRGGAVDLDGLRSNPHRLDTVQPFW